MNTIYPQQQWIELNQQYLTLVLKQLRESLQARVQDPEQVTNDAALWEANYQDQLTELTARMSQPPALEVLCSKFGLSEFERSILLCCAGVELDTKYLELFRTIQGEFQNPLPTFATAMALLPDAHWSALSPDKPLRYWRLIELGAGDILTYKPLRIDERILNYLVGVQHLDQRLSGLIEPVIPVDNKMCESYLQLLQQVIGLWSRPYQVNSIPAIQLVSHDPVAVQTIAQSACNEMGWKLHRMPTVNLPADPAELSALIHLWNRETSLTNSVLLLDCHEIEEIDSRSHNNVHRFIEGVSGAGLLFINTQQRHTGYEKLVVTIDVPDLSADDQLRVWQQALGDRASQLNGGLEELVSQFNLTPTEIHAAYTSISEQVEDPTEFKSALNASCRAQSRPLLENLAQSIKPVARWEQLILPDKEKHLLQNISIHLRNRNLVYKRWGFDQQSSRGMGISALFVGASGTGKTMAAEVLANELNLDLYRIDLSAVVSKYIGNTEKNLRKVFDAAEGSGAILLFDEADALFGKRSDVKDSHDRYANIEVSYLLQRMETYRGLAILTTNMKDALDNAFLRRIRFIIHFPFPDHYQRGAIWQHIFPEATPTDALDITRLAQMNITGGNIRNIAMNAAFLAADAGDRVSMKHLVQAARNEYAKMEKPFIGKGLEQWL